MSPRDRGLLLDAFHEHRERVYQYLRRRLGNEADAQDLAQETYLRLLRVARSTLVRDPRAYLYRVARNLVYEQSGKMPPASSWADDSELHALEHPQPSPDAEAERAERLKLLERAVAELSPKCQAVVLLFCRDGLNQREIADRLELSKSMVQRYLAMGIAHCRKRLRKFREHGGHGIRD